MMRLTPLMLSLCALLPLSAHAQTQAAAPVIAGAKPATSLPPTDSTPPIAKQVWYGHEASERSYGYASAVRIGDTLYLSGVPAGGDMATALRRVYGGIKAVLAKHGLDQRHVVKENLYTTDVDAVANNNNVRLEFYKGETPAATWVQVQRLLMPQAVLEVEVVAQFPPGMPTPKAN
jgi:enamine deaminase RidA (YjgF/YER057c/UK114 family)